MHRFKLIPLIFSNFGNFIVRFFALLLKKKAKPSIIVNEGVVPEEGRYYTIYPQLSLALKNGMILKINRTYIPIRRNEMHLTLNLVDFSGDLIRFKLIGVLQHFKVSVPIKNQHILELNTIETNEYMLFNELQTQGVSKVSIEQSDIELGLDMHNKQLAFETISLQTKELGTLSTQLTIRLGLNEIEGELNLNNTI